MPKTGWVNAPNFVAHSSDCIVRWVLVEVQDVDHPNDAHTQHLGREAQNGAKPRKGSALGFEFVTQVWVR